MLKVVDAIKAELKLAKLDIRLLPVTSANRITLVQNGSVDLECGSTTNNTERQKQVSFSNSIFVIGTRLMTKTNSGINDFPDLAGKNVVTTAGTTSERLLRKMNEDKQMKMNIISAKDHGESFLTLETGRAVAFMMDDALLYGEMAKAKRPSDWVVVGTPQSYEAYGCMLRKDDPAFKKVVDNALAKVMTSGEAEDLRQVVPAADSAEGVEPQLPVVDGRAEHLQVAERQGVRLGSRRVPGPSGFRDRDAGGATWPTTGIGEFSAADGDR